MREFLEMTYGENTQSNKILTISKESSQPNIKINLMVKLIKNENEQVSIFL